MKKILSVAVILFIALTVSDAAFTGPPYSQQPQHDPGWIHHNGPCVQQCQPRGNTSISQCGWYASESRVLPDNPEKWLGLDFLIPNYGFAAKCACGGDKDPSWLSPSASCVRNYLHQAHQNLSNETKIAWRAAKEHWNGEFEWSLEALDPVYEMHMAAYKHCCCPHNIAPKPDWALIFVGGKLLHCELIVDAIEALGYCGCEGW